MTSVDEVSGDNAGLVLLIKGKRTKRQRFVSPLMNVADVSSVDRSSEEESGEIGGFQGSTDEDEDMANCLMLLSQGHKPKSSSDHVSTQTMCFLSNKKAMASLGLGLGLGGVYKCKTCDKNFQSFQALGGHRASHKKPKLGPTKREEKTFASAFVGSFHSLQVTGSNGNRKPRLKTHECAICKAEFSSGQALGGHMRRHRGLTVNANANAALTIKTEIISSSSHHLELDLNLPAPEDEPKFAFASNYSLIDCHH